MSASLRFVLILLALAAAATPVAVAVIHEQDVRQARLTAEQMTGGDSRAGKALVTRYGCVACHEFSQGQGPSGLVGPPLTGFASRAEIAGRLANQPDQLAFWLRHPQAVVPGNGMPDQSIGERDARDISAYLYTLRKTS